MTYTDNLGLKLNSKAAPAQFLRSSLVQRCCISTISNFHHNSVLRAALTPVAGELVSVENGTHTFTSAISSNIENMNNVRIVAFLINGQGKTQNVRAAEIGDVQTLEIVN